jgi:hypothetical protein
VGVVLFLELVGWSVQALFCDEWCMFSVKYRL